MRRIITILVVVLLFALLVIESPKVYATETGEKVVYLTFDDGPTKGVTEDILDELQRLNIKGTFFVVGKEIIDKEDILKRMYDEGHGIGLHTYTHNYNKVYSSVDTFVEEMKKTADFINEVLQQDANIKYIRFPGGSSGRLNQEFYDALKAQGYNIFDWNVNLEDGVKPNATVYELVENAKKSRDDVDRKIILAHCNLNNKNTVTAINGIYEYYTNQGYEFKAITNETLEYYYSFKK
ncbi:MAG: polysaccharide deacetylase [Epulopiscium sp. Nuni2H_MBin003]|nr:MAG: polysaccharide deacetylase [Epulopiscium sp. Nuni2H_MBin003]